MRYNANHTEVLEGSEVKLPIVWTLARTVALGWCGWLWYPHIENPLISALIGGLIGGWVALWFLQRRYESSVLLALLAFGYDLVLVGMIYHPFRTPTLLAWLFALPMVPLTKSMGLSGGVVGAIVAPFALWLADLRSTPELGWGIAQVVAIGLMLALVAQRASSAPPPETLERLAIVLEQTESANRQLRSRYRELAHHYRTLQENLETTRDALELLNLLRQADSPRKAYELLLSRLRSRFGASGVALYLTDPTGLRLTVAMGVGTLANLSGTLNPDQRQPPLRQQVHRQVAEHLKDSVIQVEDFATYAHRFAAPRLLSLPLRTEERLLGVLVLVASDPEGFAHETQHRLEALLPHLIAFLRLYEQMHLLSTQLQENQLLSDLDSLLFSSDLMDEIPQRALQILQPVYAFEHAQFWLVRTDRPERVAQIGPDVEIISALRFGGKQGFEGWQTQQFQPLLIPDIHQSPIVADATALSPLQSLVLIPLHTGTRLTGALMFGHSRPSFFHEAHLESLLLVAGHLLLVYERARLLTHLERLAITDGLTGLYNYRYFQERFKEEVRLTRRYQHPLALMLIDLDNFKRINDKYGHLEGDYLLVQVAELLQSTLRSTELIARYGGDEFVVLLPSTNLKGASSAAERLLEACAHAQFSTTLGQPTLQITCSIGIAAYPETTDDPAKLLELADSALEKAKRNGRNQLASVENLV